MFAKEEEVESQIFPHPLENEMSEVWNLFSGFQVLNAEFNIGNLKRI